MHGICKTGVLGGVQGMCVMEGKVCKRREGTHEMCEGERSATEGVDKAQTGVVVGLKAQANDLVSHSHWHWAGVLRWC